MLLDGDLRIRRLRGGGCFVFRIVFTIPEMGWAIGQIVRLLAVSVRCRDDGKITLYPETSSFVLDVGLSTI